MPLSAQTISTLSRLLDEMLDVPPAQREAWLRALPAEHAALAPHLRSMMEARTGQGLLGGLPQLVSAQESGDGVQPGDVIGNYRVQRQIGRGGMGTVWLAERSDGTLQRPVALKLPRLAWEGGLATRMAQEREIGARLEHPNIARLYDAGVDARGWPFLAFEYIDGLPLDRYCTAQGLDVRGRIELIIQVARAVAYAHGRLVVHRDLKPSNVLVTPDGQAHLLDFGIAKLLQTGVPGEGHHAPDATHTRARAMTLHYASPEQVRGEPITVATDVYSLGVLAYELLTHGRPFQPLRDTAGALEEAILAGEPPLASRRAPPVQARALKGDLDAILAKALHREAAQRYPSADALADDLQRHLDHAPVAARPPSAGYTAARFLRRHRLGAVATALVLAMATLASVQVWTHRRQAELSAVQSQTANELLKHVFSGMSPDAAQEGRFSARELLERAQNYLDTQGVGDETVRAQARWRMAELFEEVGAYDNAARVYRLAEDRARAQKDDVAIAEAVLQLADMELRAENVAPAWAALGRVPTAQRQVPTVQARIETLSGELHIQQGQPRQAIAALERAQQLMDAAGWTDALWQARAAQVLGSALRRDVQLQRARQAYERALQWQGRRQPPSPVDTLLVEKDIAVVETWSGRFAAAQATLARIHPELRRRVGPGSVHTIVAANELAYAWLRQGRFTEAMAVAQQLIADVATHRLPTDTSEFMDTIVARVAMYEGRHEEAVASLSTAVQALERGKGGVSTLTEPLRRIHGEALLRAGKTDLALKRLREAEANQVRLSGDGHATVALTRLLLGTALARQGDVDAAQHTWRRAHPALLTQYGAAHPFVVACSAYLALGTPLPPEERASLAQGLMDHQGWQPGAKRLADWVKGGDASAMRWAELPVVF